MHTFSLMVNNYLKYCSFIFDRSFLIFTLKLSNFISMFSTKCSCGGGSLYIRSKWRRDGVNNTTTETKRWLFSRVSCDCLEELNILKKVRVLLCGVRPGEELKKGSYHAVFEYAVWLHQTVTRISDLFWIKMFYLVVLS